MQTDRITFNHHSSDGTLFFVSDFDIVELFKTLELAYDNLAIFWDVGYGILCEPQNF